MRLINKSDSFNRIENKARNAHSFIRGELK